jgi:hypothetical protein
MATVEIGIKEEAHRIVDQLPPGATWEDLMFQLYVRQRMDQGIRDLDEGRSVTTEQLRKNLGLVK